MTKNPRELAARALCRAAGHAENTMFEGKPMWVSFLDDVDTVLAAIREPSEHQLSDRVIRDAGYAGDIDQVWRGMIDVLLKPKVTR